MCDGKGPHSITMRVNVAAISVAIALERARPSRGDPVKREARPRHRFRSGRFANHASNPLVCSGGTGAPGRKRIKRGKTKATTK